MFLFTFILVDLIPGGPQVSCLAMMLVAKSCVAKLERRNKSPGDTVNESSPCEGPGF